MSQPAPKLVVGLGNPGSEYAETRHNAGFWFCERLARELGTSFSKEARFHGLAANARQDGVWLLMPQTFMNRSGQSVAALARFYRIEPAEILVVHDELDIPPGQLRLKFGGGLGGHNGLKDITAHLGTQDFWRLRVGIGHLETATKWPTSSSSRPGARSPNSLTSPSTALCWPGPCLPAPTGAPPPSVSTPVPRRSSPVTDFSSLP